MKRAFLQLRYTMPARRAMFREGLENHGFRVFENPTTDPREGDLLLTWNRIREGHDIAKRFEQVGGTVLVAENATWGNTFAGFNWHTIARGRHNTAGHFDIGDSSRFDDLHVQLDDWRKGGETVILPQRGIGQFPQAMPLNWAAQYRHFGRVRPHPGTGPCVPLREDLAQAGKVITWASGAAVLACMWGIPVQSDMPGWVGAHEPTDESRLAMLRRLVWCQWKFEEISNGYAFDQLLGN